MDHWTYTLDLIESYLNIFPDQTYELLFESEPIPFFDSPAFVNPRSKKYVLDKGQPRQLNAVVHLEEKQGLVSGQNIDQNWIRSNYGSGEIFRLNLFSKLVFLSIIKFSTRDPFGMGIEMEAGRPGWCDALNGLPGLFGSSMSESFELARLLDYLISVLQNTDYQVNLHLEAAELLTEILAQLAKDQTAFQYWDAVATAREIYREKTRFGLDGKTLDYSSSELVTVLQKMRQAVQAGIERALEFNPGFTPTYFTYRVTDFTLSGDYDSENREIFIPAGFQAVPLPVYLEGPVNQMKILQDPQERLELYHQVRKSQLFDTELETYKLNASLEDQSFSIGRARAFPRGWLENESVWLHMTFKYLLEILKAGLYEVFFRDIRMCLPAFLDPEVYGRSPLENSSFIVSSAHPDRSLHGRGHVARLSGATAEFISMWFIMMTGGKPFSLDQQGKLKFCLLPVLPDWLFPEQGVIEYNLLGNILVQVHNPSRKNTWEMVPSKYILYDAKTQSSVIPSSISESVSKSIRDGLYHRIEIHY